MPSTCSREAGLNLGRSRGSDLMILPLNIILHYPDENDMVWSKRRGSSNPPEPPLDPPLLNAKQSNIELDIWPVPQFCNNFLIRFIMATSKQVLWQTANYTVISGVLVMPLKSLQ